MSIDWNSFLFGLLAFPVLTFFGCVLFVAACRVADRVIAFQDYMSGFSAYYRRNHGK